LEDLNDDFKKQHLPPGFLKHDPEAQAKVLSLVRDINKHVRGQVRDLLLYNIVDQGGEYMRTALVPTINELALFIYRALDASEASKSDQDIKEKISTLLRGQLAHLRIQTVKQFIHLENIRKSQLDIIDGQLQQLKALGSDY
jgi:hypothetical protein